MFISFFLKLFFENDANHSNEKFSKIQVETVIAELPNLSKLKATFAQFKFFESPGIYLQILNYFL